MEALMGLLRVRVKRGINLISKDSNTSDPYVIISSASQKVKTKHVKNDCNPVWDDEVTLAVHDLNAPINLAVYDKDTFTTDDKLGEAFIDIKPYIEYLKAGLDVHPTGTVVDKIHPNRENSLADISHIIWKDGVLVQDMVLRLSNVATGEVEIQLEWKNVPGSTL